MKKLFILFLTVIFISTIFTVSIFADAVGSISISSKACPQLIEKTYNDISYVAEIKNDTETIYVDKDSLVTIALANKDKTNPKLSTSLLNKVQQTLNTAYTDLTIDEDLGEIGLNLNEAAKEIISNFNASVFVVSDIFAVTVSDVESTDNITRIVEGSTLTITLGLNLDKNDITPVFLFLPIEIEKDDYGQTAVENWVKIDSSKITRNINLTNDTVTVELPSIGVLAVLKVNPENLVTDTPTGSVLSKTYIIVWVAAGVVFLCSATYLIIKGNKNNSVKGE